MDQIQQFAQRLGYQFRNPELLDRALTHRSLLHDRRKVLGGLRGDNEQFEFLGDSILGFVVSEELVRAHPDFSEGQLSRRKAHFVSATHLYECALDLEIGEMLRLGRGEERNGGRERRTLLVNALEAIIAAIHLDSGIESAREFIRHRILAERHLPEELEVLEGSNYKSVLQEQAQARTLPTPRYYVIETSGPEHSKSFLVEVRVGEKLSARATGSSKKVASQQAARQLLEDLSTRGWQRSGDSPSVVHGVPV